MNERERQAAAMDALVSWILITGVAASAALLATALVWEWIATGSPALAFALPGRDLVAFVASAATGLRTLSGPKALADLGLAILMLTPYVRVLASIVFFAVVEHDWKYTAFTAFVASVLTYSLFLR